MSSATRRRRKILKMEILESNKQVRAIVDIANHLMVPCWIENPLGGSRAFALERILPVHVVRLPNPQNYVLRIWEEISKADGDNDKSWIDKIESAVSRRDEV